MELDGWAFRQMLRRYGASAAPQLRPLPNRTSA